MIKRSRFSQLKLDLGGGALFHGQRRRGGSQARLRLVASSDARSEPLPIQPSEEDLSLPAERRHLCREWCSSRRVGRPHSLSPSEKEPEARRKVRWTEPGSQFVHFAGSGERGAREQAEIRKVPGPERLGQQGQGYSPSLLLPSAAEPPTCNARTW